MILNEYIACICEGSAEHAIMHLLLESDKLIFAKEQLLNEDVLRCRSAKNFERLYLRKDFKKKITVLRILDSRNEIFKLSKQYENKISVIDIITAPEIEMLIIHSEDKYNNFIKSKKKPSEFCKTNLGIRNVKNYKFVMEYFNDVNKLVDSIRKYRKKANLKNDEKTLCDLLK